GPGRRSKSLGGVPSAARFDEDDNANGNDGHEAGCVGDADGGCVNNLFKRFAARPQHHHPPTATPPIGGRPSPAARKKPGTTEDRDDDDRATVATNELRATASPAAATLSEADDDHHQKTKPKINVHAGGTAAGAKEDGAASDDAPLPGELFAQKDTPSRTTPLTAVPLSSPPARDNSQGRTADRPRVGAGGNHDVGGLASVDGKGTNTCCTTTATNSKKSSCSVRNLEDKYICRRGSSNAGSSERRKSRSGSSSAAGRKTKDLAGGNSGLSPDIFAQFMYSPPSR
ncbi:unnamed protein product, partial [Ectocarpus sp. 12 AP-2014]